MHLFNGLLFQERLGKPVMCHRHQKS